MLANRIPGCAAWVKSHAFEIADSMFLNECFASTHFVHDSMLLTTVAGRSAHFVKLCMNLDIELTLLATDCNKPPP